MLARAGAGAGEVGVSSEAPAPPSLHLLSPMLSARFRPRPLVTARARTSISPNIDGMPQEAPAAVADTSTVSSTTSAEAVMITETGKSPIRVEVFAVGVWRLPSPSPRSTTTRRHRRRRAPAAEAAAAASARPAARNG